MPDYKAMYFKLFATYCDVMEILQKATQEMEEMAMKNTSLMDFPAPMQPEQLFLKDDKG